LDFKGKEYKNVELIFVVQSWAYCWDLAKRMKIIWVPSKARKLLTCWVIVRCSEKTWLC